MIELRVLGLGRRHYDFMKHLTGPNEVFLSTLLILFETEKIISVYTLFFFLNSPIQVWNSVAEERMPLNVCYLLASTVRLLGLHLVMGC